MKHKIPDDSIMGRAYDSRLMRRLLIYIKPYKLHLSLAIFLLLAATATELAGPLLIKNGIDNYIARREIVGLGWIVLLFIGLLASGMVLRFFQIYVTSWIGERVVLDLRQKLFTHLQRLPLGVIDSRPVGWWMTRITNDVQTLYEMFSSVLVSFFGDLLALVGILAVMWFINWKLALLSFIVLPPLILVVFIFRSRVRATFRIIREALAKLNGFMQEQITGARTIQLFNRHFDSELSFHNLNTDYRNAYLKAIRYYALFFPSITFLLALSTAIILLAGGHMILAGVLTWGSLVAFLQYAERFFRPIRDLAERYNTMQAAMAAAERVFWLLDSPTEKYFVAQDSRPTQQSHYQPEESENHLKKGEIVFDSVSFAYKRGEPVLENVSFIVKPGSTTAIVGATGAGKSTLISLLLRFWDVDSGFILFNGEDIRNTPLDRLRSSFGIVLQDSFLFSGSIKDNIVLGKRNYGDEHLRNTLIESSADVFINKLPNSVDELVGERGAKLSVGERQLISIARTLILNPDVLLLDEATSSVDTETEIYIQNAFDRLMTGRTTLVIAHRLSTIRKADSIVVLHKGRVHEIGTHKELLESDGLYARLYRLQFSNNI